MWGGLLGFTEVLSNIAGGFIQNQRAEEAAKWDRANQARVEGGLTDRMTNALQMFDQGQMNSLAGLRNNRVLDEAALTGYAMNSMDYSRSGWDRLRGMNDQQQRGLVSGYGDLRSRIMGDMAGLGSQERKDIAQRYSGLANQTTQNMANMGLGNSTVASSMLGGVRRQETDEMGRLEERLRRERIGTDIQLSQAQLAAQERASASKMGLEQAATSDDQNLRRGFNDAMYNLQSGGRAQQLAAENEAWTNRANLYTGLSGDLYNYAGGREYPMVNSNNFLTVGNAIGQFRNRQAAQSYANAMQDQADNAWWQAPLSMMTGGLVGGTTAGLTGAGAFGMMNPA